MMCMKTAALANNDILFSILELTLCQSKQYLSALCKYNNSDTTLNNMYHIQEESKVNSAERKKIVAVEQLVMNHCH